MTDSADAPAKSAWRNEQITEQEFDALCRIAEDPKATTGVLDWSPRRVTQRKHGKGGDA